MLFVVFLIQVIAHLEIKIKISMYLRYILLLLKQKYEISAVDCTQIKDLNNLCVRPTIDCLQVTIKVRARLTTLH